jgi:hypothetical protein
MQCADTALMDITKVAETFVSLARIAYALRAILANRP